MFMYKQFNKNSRAELSVLLKAGLSRRFCAKQLGFNHSAVIREANKNKDDDGVYRGASAHKKYLERRKKSKQKYRRRRGTKQREKQREESKIKRIDTRPEIVEKRERLGDFEGDTIIGKNRTKRLLTNVERVSGYGMINKVDAVSAENLQEALKQRFKKISKSKRHTYTYDNGTEIGKEDRYLEKKMGMDIYRAYPYHSWERGSSENYNGLVRDFFPKGTDFANISINEVRRVERNLNNRPRKRLGYLTPHEVFVLEKRCGAVQVSM